MRNRNCATCQHWYHHGEESNYYSSCHNPKSESYAFQTDYNFGCDLYEWDGIKELSEYPYKLD